MSIACCSRRREQAKFGSASSSLRLAFFLLLPRFSRVSCSGWSARTSVLLFPRRPTRPFSPQTRQSGVSLTASHFGQQSSSFKSSRRSALAPLQPWRLKQHSPGTRPSSTTTSLSQPSPISLVRPPRVLPPHPTNPAQSSTVSPAPGTSGALATSSALSTSSSPRSSKPPLRSCRMD